MQPHSGVAPASYKSAQSVRRRLWFVAPWIGALPSLTNPSDKLMLGPGKFVRVLDVVEVEEEDSPYV